MKFFRRFYWWTLMLIPASFRSIHGRGALRMASARIRQERGFGRLRRGLREVLDLVRLAVVLRREQRPDSLSLSGMDFAWAIKSLRRSRGFVLTTVGTLGLGIAMCMAVMAVVNAYLLRGLPYPHADRLHWINFAHPENALFQRLETLNWQSLDDVLEVQISWDSDGFTLHGAPYAEAASGVWITPGYIEGFGTRPVLGRTFQAQDFAPDAPLVTIISHRLWQSRFHGAPDIIGRRMEMSTGERGSVPMVSTIVGVLPADQFSLTWHEVLAPLRSPARPYVARFRPGVTAEIVAERVKVLAETGDVTLPPGWRLEVRSALDVYVAQIRPLLSTLAVATGLVLLLACANVVVLFMVRTTERGAEVAVRKALGATGWRVARTFGTEALLLGGAATLSGCALAYAMVSAAAPALGRYLGRVAPGGASMVGIDATTLVVGLGAGLIVTAVSYAAQVIASQRVPALASVSGSQRGATAGRGQRHLQAALIVTEVAVCLTLLVGATLMISSALRILNVDMGLDTKDVLVGQITPGAGRFPDNDARAALYERMSLERAGVPGFEDIGFSNAWPLQETVPRPVGASGGGSHTFSTTTGLALVSPGYFSTLKIPTVDGRVFTSTDRASSEPVVVISGTLAKRLWPNDRAVGKRLRIGPAIGSAPGGAVDDRLVVGVVGDLRHAHTDQDLADVYLPLLQDARAFVFVYVRSTHGATAAEPALREFLRRFDPDLPLSRPLPLSDILDRQRASAEFLTSLLVTFAVFSVTLALMGMYGVVAYTVRQRRREVAVRLAIGARRAAIVGLFVREGATLLAAGVCVGVGGALVLGRVLETQLFGVNRADPVAIAVASLALGLCGIVAILRPALHAAAIDPGIALKGS